MAAKDSIILVSGGLDSTTLLYEYADRIAMGVSFDYGANQNSREIAMAEASCGRLGVKHITVPLAFMKDYFKSSLLEGDAAVPEGRYDDANMRSTVVPFRNGIMLSIACGLAESEGLHYVLIANHSGDHAIYPDCRPGFIGPMSEAMKAGTYAGVEILAPYTEITKADIVRRGTVLGIDYKGTWSCYRGGKKHCGRCGTCTERREAFRLAGVLDPTEYEE